MQRFSKLLAETAKEFNIDPGVIKTLDAFQKTYIDAGVKNGFNPEYIEELLIQLAKLVASEFKHPSKFDLYHEAIRKPFDYYQFGIDFIKPLIDWDQSAVYRMEIVDTIEKQLKQGENVILLANHQTEPDPQAISILLEEKHPKLAEEMIFVAGHRVISDPLAIPFSKGRNLLCIYSKKYVETPPEQKPEKLSHNQKTMRKMSQLLDEGGKCIYVAPSGGRDRPNAKGVLEVANFDANSIEMFYLMTQQTKTKTHFYPLALATYNILPPPNSINKDLGEIRSAKCSPIKMAFGEEVDMENFDRSELADKKQRRKLRADHFWKLVKQDYDYIIKDVT